MTRLPIGTTRQIDGRKLTLRGYRGDRITWIDMDTRELVRTGLDFKASRKPRGKQPIKWEDEAHGESVAIEVRQQIERLARQLDLPVRLVKKIRLEAT